MKERIGQALRTAKKATAMRLEHSSRIFVWLATAAVALGLLVTTYVDHEGAADYGVLALNVLLLAITATTLHFTLPRNAKIWIGQQSELEHSDLIFFIVGDSDEGMPRDVLLDAFVAVANLGGRQAVLSHLKFDGLLDRTGQVVNIGVPAVSAYRYEVRTEWLDTFAILKGQTNNLQKFAVRQELPTPLLLRPDDVMTLRIRSRAGIDWSENWDIKALEALGKQLLREITKIRLIASFRVGSEFFQQTFEVPISVIQQEMYLRALRHSTNEFSTRPDFPFQGRFEL